LAHSKAGKITRRYMLVSALAGTVARTDAPSKLNRMAERQNLAIIGDRLSATVSNVLEALTVAGQDAGPLAVVDHAYPLSFSPDGCWVAWFPMNRTPWRTPTEFRVFYADGPRSARSAQLNGGRGEHATISSSAQHLAIVTAVDSARYRTLHIVNPATAEVEADLSDTIRRFNSTTIERLRISGDGRIVAVGSSESFVVVEVPSGKVVHETPGRYPSLSPAGNAVAFVRDGELRTTTIGSSASRSLTGRWYTAYGAGAWSPDGTFILAGVRSFLGFFTHLVAIDSLTGEIANIMRLDEGDSGGDWVWIKRSLLSN
jgi:hypothetical protein